jgi:methanogenic corrinoid protein MtbC1
MIDGDKIYEAMSNGDVETVKRLTQEALDVGKTAKNVLENGLIASLDRIGVKFKNEEIYIPEVLIAARAMTPFKKHMDSPLCILCRFFISCTVSQRVQIQHCF